MSCVVKSTAQFRPEKRTKTKKEETKGNRRKKKKKKEEKKRREKRGEKEKTVQMFCGVLACWEFVPCPLHKVKEKEKERRE